MTNPFGTQLEYNPIPKYIHLEVIGREQIGKSSLVAQWVRDGLVAVVDADGRFPDVVPSDSKSKFFPISDTQADMINVDRITTILNKARPTVGGETSAIVIDTLTKILDPIIQEIQAKPRPTVYDYRKKSDAMKKLRTALNAWDCETIWVYHKVQYFKEQQKAGGGGKEYILSERNSLSQKEYSRLGADITLSLEVIADDTGKRGVKIVSSRGGRSGFTYWDESGTWENIRSNLEEAIWGGLTKVEQVTLTEDRDVILTSADQARRWAWTFSEDNGNFFNDAAHVDNAYEKTKQELMASGDKVTATDMFSAWKLEVFRRELEAKETANE